MEDNKNAPQVLSVEEIPSDKAQVEVPHVIMNIPPPEVEFCPTRTNIDYSQIQFADFNNVQVADYSKVEFLKLEDSENEINGEDGEFFCVFPHFFFVKNFDQLAMLCVLT